VGCPVGSDEGWAEGRLVGKKVGLLDVGAGVGRLVSPGRVGWLVLGDLDGREVGAVEVGIEVGTLTTVLAPTTTTGSRMALME
jgi:hypothetical protein